MDHEIAGEIVEVGDGVSGRAVGDRVQVIAAVPCGRCEECSRGQMTVSSNLVHYRELTIVGANGSSPQHNKDALELISTGAVPVSDLITHRLPLDSVLEGPQIVAAAAAIKVTTEP
jgi:threonine dehydrogenase-like Zn-dependent dehydrogenase